MEFRCEAAERLQHQPKNERSPAWLARARRAGEGKREGGRHPGRRAAGKRLRGLRKADREKTDETKPKKAFYFSSLKNKKQTLCFN